MVTMCGKNLKDGKKCDKYTKQMTIIYRDKNSKES